MYTRIYMAKKDKGFMKNKSFYYTSYLLGYTKKKIKIYIAGFVRLLISKINMNGFEIP